MLSRAAALTLIVTTMAAGLGACSETRSVTASGVVLDLTGAPVPDAEVFATSPQSSQTVQSGADGRFNLVAAREYSGVVLPASGVFLDPVYITAQDAGRIAYSAANALSTSEEAHSEAVLILVSTQQVETSHACEAMEPVGRYAFTLSAELDADAAWLDTLRRREDTAALHDLLSGAVVRAARACNLSEDQWQTAQDRLADALDPYAEN